MNPFLDPSLLLNLPHPFTETIMKFPLGSHKISIENGSWKGLYRCDRVCPECKVLGDEDHYLFRCSTGRSAIVRKVREPLEDTNVFELFSRLVDTDLF